MAVKCLYFLYLNNVVKIYIFTHILPSCIAGVAGGAPCFAASRGPHFRMILFGLYPHFKVGINSVACFRKSLLEDSA